MTLRMLVVAAMAASLLVVVLGEPAHAASYYDTIISNGPTSYYPLETWQGTSCGDPCSTPDVMGHTGDLQRQLSPTVNEPGAILTAPSTKSVKMAPGAYLTADTSAWMNPTALTLELWFKTDVGFTGPGVLFKSHTTGTQGDVALEIDSNGHLIGRATYNDALGFRSEARAEAESSVVSDGAWHHAMLVAQASGVTLFADGALADEAPSPMPILTWAAEYYGAIQVTSGLGGGDFQGWVDEAVAYNRPMTLTDERGAYAASGRTPPPLILNGGPLSRFEAGSPSEGCPLCQYADPVTLPFGTFSHSWSDLSVPGRGPALNLSHTYSTNLASTNGPLGYGFTFSYNISLSNPGTGFVTVNEEGGSQIGFVQCAQDDTRPACDQQPTGAFVPAAPRILATLTHDYDSVNLVWKWTFRRRNTSVFTFNDSGQLTQIKDLNEEHTDLTYQSGRLSTVTDPAGRVLTFSWDVPNNRITDVSDQATPVRTVAFEYNANGEMSHYHDVANGDWVFTYEPDGSHRMWTMQDPRQTALPSPKVVENHYDAYGRVDWQKDQNGNQTSFNYLEVPGGVVTTLPGNTVNNVPEKVLEAFADGVPISVTKGYPSASTWVYEYDPNVGQVTKVTDPNTHVTRFEYNAAGNRTVVKDALGRPDAVTSYNGLNEPVMVTDRMVPSVTATYTYDAAGNLTSKSTPIDATRAAVWTYRYGENGAHAGDLTSMSDPNHPYVDASSKQWKYQYDSYGNQTSVSDPMTPVNTKLSCFDSIGRVTKTISPKGTAAGVTCTSTRPAPFTTYYDTYTAFGDLKLVTDPLGHTLQRDYDPNRNVASSTDQNDNPTTYVYDDANRLTEVHRADTSVVKTAYWPDGSLQSQTDTANNPPTQYAYSPLGQLTGVTDPLGNTTTYGYDLAGNPTTKQDPVPGATCTATPKVGCRTSTYHADDELKTVTYSDGTTPTITDITYDNNGRRLSLTQSNGVNSTWDYFKTGWLKTSSDGSSGTISYDYDLAGNNTSITYPGSHPATRHFDDAGRLDSVTDWNSKTTTFEHDENSNVKATNFAAGTGGAQIDNYTFDDADRIASSTFKKGAGSTASLTYTRDNAGQLTKSVNTGQAIIGPTETYGYNNLNQIKKLNGTVTWTYDPADNLTKSLGWSQKFNAADQLCFASQQTGGTCTAPPSDATLFSYDTRGNRIKSDPAGSIPTSYSYDQANRLTSAAVPVAGGTGQYTAVTPTNVLDTPVGTGTCKDTNGTTITCTHMGGGGPTTMDVQVGGLAGVPLTNVAAVQLTATVSNTHNNGNLKVYPPQISASSAVNVTFQSNETVSNSVIVQPGADGYVRLTMSTNADADVLLDVTGWYATSAGPEGAVFTPTDPARLADTTNGTGTCKVGSNPAGPCAQLGINIPTDVKIAGVGAVPATGVSAVAINLTTSAPAGAGGLTAYASGATKPADPQVNYNNLETISGLVIVPVASNGRITLNSSTATHVAVDIQGWFSANSTSGGNILTTVNPTRLLSTVTPTGNCTPNPCATLGAGGTLQVLVTGTGGVPATGVAAVVITLTSQGSTVAGSITAYPSDRTRPEGANVNYGAGERISNQVIVKPAADGTILLYATTVTDAFIDVSGYFSSATNTTTYGYNGDGLRTTKTGTAGTTSYAWNKASGLPLLLTETAGSNTTYYLYDAAGLPFEQINPDGSITWYHHDQLGSTRLATTTAGVTVGSYKYDAYGTRTRLTGTTITPFGYAGQYTDPETGLQYLRARYYEPATGQLLTRDPAVSTTRDAYGYAARSPLNRTDPSGLMSADSAEHYLNTGYTMVSAPGCEGGFGVERVPPSAAAYAGRLTPGQAVDAYIDRAGARSYEQFLAEHPDPPDEGDVLACVTGFFEAAVGVSEMAEASYATGMSGGTLSLAAGLYFANGAREAIHGGEAIGRHC